MRMVIDATLWIWLALELGLVIRDRRRGIGSPARDRGTRILFRVMTIGAMSIGYAVASTMPHDSTLYLPGARVNGWHVYGGVALMWIGLVVRAWAITALGPAFRTTVGIEPGQMVVDRGPYRCVRHPSYTGALLAVVGYGIVLNNWISLAVTIVLPLIAVLRRISVAEEALVEMLGTPYRAYQARSKRLVPGVW
jgi:protein-S-isoprenylcysteine O-methyltransferase Ste14